MPRSKKVSLHVIFFWPQSSGGTNKYYDDNGAPTGSKNEAAKFYTFEDAKEFADKMKIELSETRYIGQEEYLQSDLDRLESIKQMKDSYKKG